MLRVRLWMEVRVSTAELVRLWRRKRMTDRGQEMFRGTVEGPMEVPQLKQMVTRTVFLQAI